MSTLRRKSTDNSNPVASKKVPLKKVGVKAASDIPTASDNSQFQGAKRESGPNDKSEREGANTPLQATDSSLKTEQSCVKETKVVSGVTVVKAVKKVVKAKKVPGQAKTPVAAKILSADTPGTEQATKILPKETEQTNDAPLSEPVVPRHDDSNKQNGAAGLKKPETEISKTVEEASLLHVGTSELHRDVEVGNTHNADDTAGAICNDDKETSRDNSVQKENKKALQGAVGSDEYIGDEGFEEYGDHVDFDDHGEDDFVEDESDVPDQETEAMDEEQNELTAITEERKSRKEYEIFVGGLDRDATQEDLRSVFGKIGEVVEIRLNMNPLTNKNKGYAFVKFAKKEHVKQALSELKNPVIHGKRCGTAASEDNDTLFLGNICNTWTKEAIRQKLSDYGVESVHNITLVPDVQQDGRSRGFAFIEFPCHADAMNAYKRLQKPDVVFGHPDRTAKVAFAEPIRDPDPEVMAQVKTVFVDGLPPHWDEDNVRDYIKRYGEIVRVVLARNMSTAKRKDFGFIDFSTHDSAVACIDGLNNTEIGDGSSKTKIRARLSNPMPKNQAVKGGMRGGFRIGHGSFRSFFQGTRPYIRGGSYRGAGLYHSGHGETGRTSFDSYAYRHGERGRGRHMRGRGGRGEPFRGSFRVAPRDVAPVESPYEDIGDSLHDSFESGLRNYTSSRRHYTSTVLDRPYSGRQFDDSMYFEDDAIGGMKRRRYADDDIGYSGSRFRARLDFNEPAATYRSSRYRGSDSYLSDYYGSDYTSYSSYYGRENPRGSGFYY